MNYLKQIVRFSHIRKQLPLRCSSLALYYVILEHFNAVRFPKRLVISTSILAGELRVSSTTIRRCRQELKASKCLDYEILPFGTCYSLVEF